MIHRIPLFAIDALCSQIKKNLIQTFNLLRKQAMKQPSNVPSLLFLKRKVSAEKQLASFRVRQIADAHL
jgi:hypothetical protein